MLPVCSCRGKAFQGPARGFILGCLTVNDWYPVRRPNQHSCYAWGSASNAFVSQQKTRANMDTSVRGRGGGRLGQCYVVKCCSLACSRPPPSGCSGLSGTKPSRSRCSNQSWRPIFKAAHFTDVRWGYTTQPPKITSGSEAAGSLVAPPPAERWGDASGERSTECRPGAQGHEEKRNLSGCLRACCANMINLSLSPPLMFTRRSSRVSPTG